MKHLDKDIPVVNVLNTANALLKSICQIIVVKLCYRRLFLRWLLLLMCNLFHFQVLSRLSELETTLEAGLRHRDAALNSIAFQLTKWMNMVRFLCLVILLLKLI